MEFRIVEISSQRFFGSKNFTINSISALCESTGANIQEVALAIGSDSRAEKFWKQVQALGVVVLKKIF